MFAIIIFIICISLCESTFANLKNGTQVRIEVKFVKLIVVKFDKYYFFNGKKFGLILWSNENFVVL